ncbi:cyclin-dependent kinase [Akanthomyces lecanii RCEF 1005]|uniref:Cyclin-dependent kinase n=1 Tax=Akanthomyces lecanii RCEF 1005 TaxID=1081108 RepID=A0A168HXB3_CORDF|nr:cyclin-dependent kinase [Akanthomyces lecanii RCEF 1005]
MSQPGPGASSGEAVPSSSASSRRDGNDFTVPATPPIANAHAEAGAASSTFHASGIMNGISGASQKAWASSAFEPSITTAAGSAPHDSSQTIPDSQESVTMNSGDTRPAGDLLAIGAAGSQEAKSQAGQQLLQLSAIAAAQQRLDQEDAAVGSRKRTANGEVKIRSRSNSPIKGHGRSISAVSMNSAGSHIGDMSADLKTRLAYAMMKVNHGWQSRSLDEVESLASQAASPVSSNSTLHRRLSSSTSPRPPPTSAAQVRFAPDPVEPRRKSHSPPGRSGKPTLAPPAPIQPSLSKQSINGRRNPVPRHTPTLLTHSHSASAAHSYSPRQHLDAGAMSSSQPSRPSEGIAYSPHQNVREQDAIETLLFMSSPNNSSNLKHAFSPSVSPAPQQGLLHEAMHRNTPSSSFRKGLPGQRPPIPQRRVGFDQSPVMGPPPGSPMELDSPQQPYRSPNAWTPKRRANGVSGHLRGALSLPSGLGLGNGRARQALRDEDIERMLDQTPDDSSDDEDIKLPPRTNGVAGAVGI